MSINSPYLKPEPGKFMPCLGMAYKLFCGFISPPRLAAGKSFGFFFFFFLSNSYPQRFFYALQDFLPIKFKMWFCSVPSCFACSPFVHSLFPRTHMNPLFIPNPNTQPSQSLLSHFDTRVCQPATKPVSLRIHPSSPKVTPIFSSLRVPTLSLDQHEGLVIFLC